MSQKIPVGAVRIGPSAWETFLLAERMRRVTVRDLARERGVCPSTAYRHLLRLRALGLLTWEPGEAGTIRLCVEKVPGRVVFK